MHNEKTTIFIDGSSGTAGLRIYDRLAQRPDIDLLTLPPELHHDIEAQRELLNRADIAFLCLPDAAAITAADLVENPDTVVLDTSTAHRTAPGWTYGFPELSPEREAAIRTAKRIAVPGCHASGFIVLVYPLVEAGILPPDALLTCYSLTGYSGGGKKMIAEYEADTLDPLYAAPRQYGLAQQHKHLRGDVRDPEPGRTRRCSRRSWRISTAAWRRASRSSPRSSAPAKRRRTSRPPTPQSTPAPSCAIRTPRARTASCPPPPCPARTAWSCPCSGNEERILLTSVFDNLGKGASGAALECLNLVMGREKGFGLDL